jgi:uncharacterized repeat protein (TIGR01451 family)
MMVVEMKTLARFAQFVIGVCLAGVVLLSLPANAQLGQTVTNIAELSYDNGGDPVMVRTLPAEFMIEARRTPSTIEFFRYAPTAPDSFMARVHDSHYSPSGEIAGPFTPLGPPVTAGGQTLDFSSDVPLIPAERYYAGELMVVRVIDRGQNGDPNAIETVIITITASTGDEIVLCLFESGPDTGEFYAWLPSTRSQTPVDDPVISVARESELTATYTDPFDSTEVSVDTALVDPFGRLFDSLTGDLVDGATVTIVDAATGEPAEVFGVDGFSPYPSTLVTGGTVTDDSGLVYDLEPGQFLFPLMAPGTYRLIIEPTAPYIFPSIASDFGGLDNAPFTIQDGSYGLDFIVDGSGPVSFDVPLDSSAELLVRKSTSEGSAAVGDFVSYSVSVENRDTTTARVRLQDDLPLGFRYVEGSARLGSVAVEAPEIAGNGRQLHFDLGLLPPGQTLQLNYVATVTAGARNGEAINSAHAIDGRGNIVSNTAEAAIFIREDLLRSRLTIAGRVAEAACEADEDWARELEDGIGVAGVRVYMEDGTYTLTDENGLYHFEDVTPGTHVVQVDTETLPAGYEAMECEENTRYAGRATSKFVDSPGGVIWRANFYLERTGEVEEVETVQVTDGAKEYLEYDQAWLDTQTPDVAWAYPATGQSPATKAMNLGIKHGPDQRVELMLNGRPVPAGNGRGRDFSTDRSVAMTRYRSVDIEDGENLFEARILNADGLVVETITQPVWFVEDVLNVTRIADLSNPVADGRTIPTIALRVEDEAGRGVHPGRIIDVDVEAPYRLYSVKRLEGEAAVTQSIAGETSVTVGKDGIAYVQLEPTIDTGRVKLNVTLDDGRVEEITAYLSPAERDWIVVGLAEGTIGLEGLSGSGAGVRFGEDGEDLFTDGRVAFYAKGMIKGEWLMTLAVDSDKEKTERDGDFRSEIDPNAYYTLYGDRSYQAYDAVSRFPVYLKLEKQQFQFLFGDYNTGFNETVLGRYNRRMSGVRALYEGDEFRFIGFGADTDQSFVRDELPADGTSGPYRLSTAPLLRQGEVITVETRDRFRPDEVISVRNLARYVDYDIDYRTGEIIFRRPVDVTDANLNPNVIVVEYEVSDNAVRDITAGLRMERDLLGDRVEVGASLISEAGGKGGPTAEGSLAAVDATVSLGERTEIRGEYARSERVNEEGEETGDAFLIEAIHQSRRLTLNAYYREDEAGFGLGQQSGTSRGVRRYGASAAVNLGDSDDAETGIRTTRTAQFEAYREQDLTRGGVRGVAQATVRRDNRLLSLEGGLRAVEEDFQDGAARTSLMATGSVTRTFAEQGLSLSVVHEHPLSGEDQSSLFPQRTVLGLDKILTDWATLTSRHEIVEGENVSGNSSTLGLIVQPWSGAEARLESDYLTSDAGQRLGATIGLDQRMQLSEQWSASLGFARRANIMGGDDYRDPVSDPATSPLSYAPFGSAGQAESYGAAYAGVGYRGLTRAASGRLELRDTTASTRYAGIFSVAQEVDDELSIAGGARYQYENLDAEADRRSTEIRIGLAQRPRGEGLILFDRLDFRQEDIVGEMTSWKLINNLAMNGMLSDATQWSGYWGVKYARTSVGGARYDGWTQLLGGQFRHDISRRWDIGATAQVLWSMDQDNYTYAYGPVVGFRPHENVWLSVGYNVEGFVDDDFGLAEYTRQGPFLKLRIKFDQDSLRELLNEISPEDRRID